MLLYSQVLCKNLVNIGGNHENTDHNQKGGQVSSNEECDLKQ